MLKIAIYGKGGIGKSTISSNLSVALAKKGYKVMQIGCDPKADSTIQLHEGKGVASILDIIRAKGDKAGLEELVTEGSEGVLCAEAGGPTPGMGCAGRGIITAFEALEERHAFDIYRPDVVIYDVLGDVVCGGFAMPIREGYADKVFIVTSGENMAIYAAANIACAVKAFEARGYAGLGGLILNRRGVKREQEKAEELARDMGTDIIASLDFSPLVGEAEELGKTVMEVFPDSDIAGEYKKLADAVLAVCREEQVRKDNAKESAGGRGMSVGKTDRRPGCQRPGHRAGSPVRPGAIYIWPGVQRAGQGRLDHRTYRHAAAGKPSGVCVRPELPAGRGAVRGGT